MNRIFILFLIFSALSHAQKIQVVDSENSQPIPNARIVLPNQLVYTNDDGFAPVDAYAKNFEVCAQGFEKLSVSKYEPVIKLNPVVKDIDEVKIISVDIKNIFDDLSKNYQERYYNKPSLYDVTYKSRLFSNGILNFLVIAEAKFWTKSNWYSYKDGYRKKYDDILQFQLNNVKYLKRNESDESISTKSDELSHAALGRHFFNYQLDQLLLSLNADGSKYFGRLLSEQGDDQQVSFKIETDKNYKITGAFNYNKKDKTITACTVNYLQSGETGSSFTNTEGKKFSYTSGDVTVVYEFYKKDGAYLPAMRKSEGSYEVKSGDKIDKIKFSTEVIYHTFVKSSSKGLASKVDLDRKIWENIPVKEDKENAVLLSEEEQEFINQK